MLINFSVIGIADIKEEYLMSENENRRITKDMIIK